MDQRRPGAQGAGPVWRLAAVQSRNRAALLDGPQRLFQSAIREHVARGGYLGWGLWPTAGNTVDPFDSKEKQYFLANAARDLSFVDASVGLIFKRSMITGVCGSAGLAPGQEATMAQDLEDLSMGIRRRYWIAATTDVDPDDPLT